MSQPVIEIVICLGSSCFARGNKKTLNIIQQYLKDHQLEDQVNFKGNHCFGNCHNGPVLKINGRIYERINEMDMMGILEKELGNLKKV